jgi:hypothetical protein
MSYFEPFDGKEWFEELARSTRIRALGSREERIRATLLDVSETYLRLAAMHEDYCFCGREATCYKFSRGKRLGLCHLHAAAWETFAEQDRAGDGPSRSSKNHAAGAEPTSAARI